MRLMRGRTFSVCYPTGSLFPRTGPDAELLRVCQMKATTCLVVGGPGRTHEWDRAVIKVDHEERREHWAQSRKGLWNHLRYIREWECELVKKKLKQDRKCDCDTEFTALSKEFRSPAPGLSTQGLVACWEWEQLLTQSAVWSLSG